MIRILHSPQQSSCRRRPDGRSHERSRKHRRDCLAAGNVSQQLARDIARRFAHGAPSAPWRPCRAAVLPSRTSRRELTIGTRPAPRASASCVRRARGPATMLVVEDHEIGAARRDDAGKAGGVELLDVGTDHDFAAANRALGLSLLVFIGGSLIRDSGSATVRARWTSWSPPGSACRWH